jgi:hypothetical protein
MEEKHIEIEGKTFDLNNPEEKRAAIRAWLKAKSKAEGKLDPSKVPDEEPAHNFNLGRLGLA